MDRPPNPGGSRIANSHVLHTCSCAKSDKLVMLGWIDPSAGASSDTCVCAMEHIFRTRMSFMQLQAGTREQRCAKQSHTVFCQKT